MQFLQAPQYQQRVRSCLQNLRLGIDQNLLDVFHIADHDGRTAGQRCQSQSQSFNLSLDREGSADAESKRSPLLLLRKRSYSTQCITNSSDSTTLKCS